VANQKQKKELHKLLAMNESMGKEKIVKVRQFIEMLGVKKNAEESHR
jgi:peptidyl-tRNA hydrolase